MQPGRQRESHRPPSPQGMGVTNSIPITITASPPISGNANPTSTQNPNSAVRNVPLTHQNAMHIVQKNTCSLQADKETKCAASSDGKAAEEEDVLMEEEHKSPRQGTESANAADRTRNLPAATTTQQRWADMSEDEPDEVQPSISPPRIPTPPHPINTVRSSFPPYPSTHSESDDISPSDPVSTDGKVIIFTIDLRSPGCRYALPITQSNNESMLLRIVNKFATLKNETFSPFSILPGLIKHQIKVRTISKERMAEIKISMQQKQSRTTEAARDEEDNKSSSSSPPTDVVVYPPSHRFILKFNSSSNRDLSLTFLKKIGINAFIPSAQIIRGIVKGFPYHTTDAIITPHLMNHAWFVGGAPSLIISRIAHSPIWTHYDK